MKMTMKQVRPEDFDAQTLYDAAREGRLYLVKNEDATDDAKLQALRQREALEYVAVIDGFAAPEWQTCIHELWQGIVDDPLFTDALLMKKGRKRGQLNRYFLTNIVFRLQALDVYRCDDLVELHRKLEGVDEKNSIYKSSGAYPLSRTQQQRLLELKKIKESKINVFRPE
ncbi:MAG: hypothetical protein IJL34_00305 [Treponema sp.]|nr:hypothetical protein [Treponema sp.]